MAVVWTYALRATLVLTSGITIAACAMFFRRVRSRASLWMLVGAAGGLLTNVVSGVAGFVIQQQMPHLVSGGTASIEAAIALSRTFNSAVGLVGFGFAMLFSISLFIALRDAAQRLGAHAATDGRGDAASGLVLEEPA